MLFISIPQPCHENWNEMIPAAQGAFCKRCSKIVVDFTQLSDEEVQNYFLDNRGQKTCGRFRDDQLAETGNPLRSLLASALPFWKKFLAIVFILFGGLLTSCHRDIKQGSQPEEAKYEKIESSLLGFVIPGEELEMDYYNDNGVIKRLNCKPEPAQSNNVLTGDTIIFTPTDPHPDTIAMKIDP